MGYFGRIRRHRGIVSHRYRVDSKERIQSDRVIFDGGALTAHCRFGASSQRSGYIIGLTLMVLALVFGSSALSIVSAFPVGMLGVLPFYVGMQHCPFVRDIVADKKALLIAVTVASMGFMTQNLTLGFLSALAMHYGLSVMTKTKSYLAREGERIYVRH